MEDAVFIAQMTYPSLKSVERLIREIHDEVRAIAGSDFRILYRSAVGMAIGFVSDLDDATMALRFKGLRPDEDAQWTFMLTRVAYPIQGWMSGDSWTWLATRPSLRARKST